MVGQQEVRDVVIILNLSWTTKQITTRKIETVKLL
jgi:hypothetical protein